MDEVVFYSTANGNSELWDFICDLDAKATRGNKGSSKLLEKIHYTIDRAETGMPHARNLRKGIQELRPGPYRITYFKWRGKLVLLTYFKKDSQKSTKYEVDRAEQRMKDWILRYGE